MRPSGIPHPLIWGDKQPQLRLQLVKGEQVLFSKTNYNLFLKDEHFSEDGTYTIGQFLRAGSWDLWEDPYSSLPLDKQFVLTLCWKCNYEAPCRLFVEGRKETTYSYKGGEVAGIVDKLVLQRQPQLQSCPVLTAVLEQCGSKAERDFAELYYRWALLGGGYPDLGYKTTGDLQKLVDGWHGEALHDPAYRITERLIDSLSLPALIPQVWLNYVYDPYVNPKDIERTTLRDMPSRVDFCLIKEGQRHVIEIDDPSHYADFDEKSRRWEVNEERYTRNLWIERRMRQEEWYVHRFSNWEVLKSQPEELLRALGQELAIEVENLPF